ncbi:MAG: MFS transporter [Chloroflexi bacterium]|nr:MFS transporter [Chloroflexota bacterium]
MTAISQNFWRERSYLAVALTHFFVDVLNSGRTLLVALLAISIGLTNAQVGMALLIYNVGSSLSQPLFGWLADRIGSRWLVIGGIGWMILFYGLAATIGDWPALIALTIAGIGSGAFHPTGTMVASQISDTHRARATAVFFMSGQLGLFMGPVLAGIVLEQYGRPGYLILPVLASTAFLVGWQWLTHRHTHNQPTQRQPTTSNQLPTTIATPQSAFRIHTIQLAVIIMAGSVVSISAINFAPKLFTEMGLKPGLVGWLSGLFMMGSAVGGVVGGTLGDRIAGKWVIVLGAMGTILPVYFYIPAAGAARFILLLLAGFFSGMPHSILVLMAQSLLPGRRATASGLTLGFMFFSGSVGSYALGIVADNVGLATALQGTAVIPLIAAAVALLLRSQE